MNDETQHELDELLSAYLDDELPDEERRLVESRLAADPAARQTLEELRHVSQTVRRLPQQVVGRDLAESVLQRVPSSRHDVGTEASSQDMPSQSRRHGTLPKITIGRSRRGWVWASLAVAAAILIMVIQSDDESDRFLRPVAQRTNESAGDMQESTVDEISGRAWNAPAAPAGAPAAALADGSSSSDRSESLPASQRRFSGGAVSSVAGEDSLGVADGAPQSVAESSKLSESFAYGSAGEAEPPAQEQELVVVHVITKRGALANKTFDRLLEGCGVIVEPDEPAEEKQLAARESGQKESSRGGAAANRLDDHVSEPSAEEETDIDMVLVEAPPTTIYSCLDGLNKDIENYFVVDVDQPAAADETATLQQAPTKDIAADLGKFSRGFVPQQQKDAFRGEHRLNYERGDWDDRYGGQRLAGGVGAASSDKPQQSQALSRASGINDNQGRAQRLLTQGQEINGVSEPSAGREFRSRAEAITDSRQLKDVRRQLKAPAGQNSEQLQVLFVLSPGDAPAGSPAAENRAE